MPRTTHDTDADRTVSRRSVLAALGAGATGAIATTPASATTKRLVIYQPNGCHGMVEYTICVTGTVDEQANIDDWDSVTNDGTCAEGAMGPEHGNDIFTYTGSIKDVELSGPAAVIADGEVLNDPGCGPPPADPAAETTQEDAQPASSEDDDFCRFDNSISVQSQPNDVAYELETTHGIETKNGRRVDTIEADHRADYTYAGEISSFWFEGQGRAYIDQTTVCGDEQVTDTDSVPGGSHDEFCEFNQSVSAFAPDGESATVTFGASHEIQVSEGGRRVPALTFEVADDKRKTFSYSGWLTAFALDGVAEVNIRQAAPCANPDA